MSEKTFTVSEISTVLTKVREAYGGKDISVAYIIAEIESELDIL